MNLQKHYDRLFENSIQKIEADDYQMDTSLGSPQDKRFGITLLLRPSGQVARGIQAFLSELRAVAPDQYFYPSTDLHVTVMSIISCYQGFELGDVSVPDYVALIRESIKSAKHFELDFRGITASPSCVMVQGFPADDSLGAIRDNLRTNFRASQLQQSIDKRYAIQTAHITVARFTKPLVRKHEFMEVLQRFRNHPFGACTADTLELVYNDWYQRSEIVKEMHRFKLA